jgi:hypothetical protein
MKPDLLATAMSNHPTFLYLGDRSRKRLAKKIKLEYKKNKKKLKKEKNKLL